MSHRNPHILNASVNLLSICFIVMGGLRFTNASAFSFADDAARIAAIFLFVSTLLSYWSIRNGDTKDWQVVVADWSFLIGLVSLMASVCIFATGA